MGKPAVKYRRLIVTGGVTALGLATVLGLAAPSAAGAQTQGHHQKVTVVADHLNNPRGLAPAPGGGLYPTANPAGDVVRIDRWGHRTHLGAGQLFYPSGFAAGSGGAIYVSNCSIAPAGGMGPKLCPTGGQIVRIG